MGACTCVPSDLERKLSRSINDDIYHDKKKVVREKKILFLGSGGSGKSTLFKQLRLIHGEGFSDSDRNGYIKHIHTQIISQMKAIIQIYIDYHHRKRQREHSSKHSPSLKPITDHDTKYDQDDELVIYDTLTLQSPPLQDMKAAEHVINCECNRNKHCLELNIGTAIKTLWNEAIVKEIYNMRNITKIETSSAHFWDKIDEILETNYLPSNKDILLNRVITTGLHEQQFEVSGGVIHIIDVGGQRSQRRKWIHCFEHVVAVIFIASLSCYDANLDEDPMVNAMEDQLKLFKEIGDNHILRKVSIILFLNKTDLFRQKYCKDKIPLNKCRIFKRFKDEHWDYDKATLYICRKFERICTNKAKNRIFSHFTCATDTNNIEKVFYDVREIVISGNLAASGLMD